MKTSLPEILYEDNHLIALNKRSSDIVQGDKTGDKPLSELIKDYLREKYNKPGNIFAGVIHRLDRPVSGVVVFARTSKALERMNELFRTKELEKKYWALVRNKPPQEEGHLIHYLKRIESKNITEAYKEEKPGTQRAELLYRLILETQGYYLLEITLLTGRHHQIRSQLSAIGCPIIGDNKYGYPRGNKDRSIHLHSRSLEFIHPVKKEKVTIIAPLPDDVLWNKIKPLV